MASANVVAIGVEPLEHQLHRLLLRHRRDGELGQQSARIIRLADDLHSVVCGKEPFHP